MVSKEIAPALHVCAIYQQSYNTGQVPLDLQQAKVTAVFKKGDKSNPANYPSGTPGQAHDMETTSYRPKCYIMTSNRRRYNVVLRLCVCWLQPSIPDLSIDEIVGA